MFNSNKKKTKWKKFNHPKRNCYFTENKISYIDYKDTELLKRFISLSGNIKSRKVTGTKVRFQPSLARAIRRAYFMGLIGPGIKSTK